VENENAAQLTCEKRMATDFSPTGLRILREVAQLGSFSAAAQALGYTQSAVSRQVATLEAAAGRALFDRGRTGVTLTPAGARLLQTATSVLAELDEARRELAEEETTQRPVRLGAFAIAATSLVPKALTSLPDHLRVTLREATTPALVRGLRAGTLDLAVIAHQPPYRPPDSESPGLELLTLSERELMIAVGKNHPLASLQAVEVEQLKGEIWVAGRSDRGDSLLGAWPGLRERPDVRYIVRDWLAKLQIVAAGLAITTASPMMHEAIPPGVKLLAVRDEPREVRRLVVARRPGPIDAQTSRVIDALSAATR
jgi:DNA-binding transcriptional LysR family regulator